MKSIKNFRSWINEQRDPSFSAQLTQLINKEREKVDIRDVRELLELGADPNHRLLTHTDEEIIKKIERLDPEEYGFTKLPEMRMYEISSFLGAINSRRLDVIEEYLKHGADPNARTYEKSIGPITPFMFAVGNTSYFDENMKKVIKLFKDYGANVNATDDNGNNVIHREINSQGFELIPMLIELGVDPYAKNNQGKIPLDLIDPWKEYVIKGEIIRGSEVIKRFESMLKPTVEEKPTEDKRFSLFGKKK